MALPVNSSTHLIPALLLIYRPRKDNRLSWPSWLTCSGWCTHISGHPSAAGRAQDRESLPARDRRSTTVPRHQTAPDVTCIKKPGCDRTCSSEDMIADRRKHTYRQTDTLITLLRSPIGGGVTKSTDVSYGNFGRAHIQGANVWS